MPPRWGAMIEDVSIFGSDPSMNIREVHIGAKHVASRTSVDEHQGFK
jgi:hypothetical protein